MIESLLTAPVTLALVAAIIAASTFAFNNQKFYDDNVLWVEGVLRRGQWHRLLTGGFLHTAFSHIALNLWSLIALGPFVENYLGPVRFTLLYFGALLIGSGIELYIERNHRAYRSVGASGAIFAVAASIAILSPFLPMSLMFIPMPAVVLSLALIVISVLLLRRENKVISHAGHLGGALAGIILTLILVPSSGPNFISQIMGALG